MVHTSHAGLYSIAGIVASTTLGQICGAPVNVSNIDYIAIVGALSATFLDMWKRRNK